MVSACCLKKFDHEGTPVGDYADVAGLENYVTGADNGNDKLIVFATDIFGHKLKSTHLVADELAKLTGYKVLIPDYLENDPIVSFDQLETWRVKHTVEYTSAIFNPYLTKLRETLKPSKIYAIGFCYGAPFVVNNLSKDGLLDGGAIAHPSLLETSSFDNVAKSLLISSGTDDQAFVPEVRAAAIDVLSKKDIRFEINLYNGAPHGYEIKGDLSIPTVKYAKEKTIISQADFFLSL